MDGLCLNKCIIQKYMSRLWLKERKFSGQKKENFLVSNDTYFQSNQIKHITLPHTIRVTLLILQCTNHGYFEANVVSKSCMLLLRKITKKPEKNAENIFK